MYTNALIGKRLLAFLIDFGLLVGFTYLVSTGILYLMKFDFKAFNDATSDFTQSYANYATYGGDKYYESFKESFNNYLSFAVYYYSVRAAVSLVFSIVYFVIIPQLWDKQTIGRLATKTIIISHRGDTKYTLGKAILREIIGTWIIYYLFSLILSGITLIVSGIVYLMCGRSLIDLIARTDLVNNYVIEINDDTFKQNNDPNSYENYDSNQFKPNKEDFRKNEEIIDVKPNENKDINSNLNDSSDDEYDVF